MDGRPRKIAVVADIVSGLTVDNPVISKDKAATRILGSLWNRNRPTTSLFNTNLGGILFLSPGLEESTENVSECTWRD